MRRFEQRITGAVAKGDQEGARGLLLQILAYVKGWVGAFRECDDIAKWESALLCMIQLNVGPLARKVPKLYSEAVARYEYSFREYSLTR
jgi:hypothetical protein